MSLLLHYDNLAEFKRQFYKDLLTQEHLKQGEIQINKVSYPNKDTKDDFNFWGYQLEKDGVKYLLPSHYGDGKPVNLRKTLPISASNTLKVAHRGVAFQLIKDIQPMRPKPDKLMSFKELVDLLSGFSHSNPKHHKLMWFMALTQMISKANYRISTPAGFGKDSVVDCVGHLIGGSATIESPTLAKLEFLTTYKWLAVNEVVDIAKPEWRVIEQFLLSTGAFKPEVLKHSRKTSGVEETLDLNDFSLSLLYNDIDHYQDTKSYFDFVSKKALLDRFPAFRLYGTYTEDFNAIKSVNTYTYVKEHFDDYRSLISTYAYFKQNFFGELKGFTTTIFDNLGERWKTNIGRLLRVVDLYSEDQEEFDSWCNIIKASLDDYQSMLKYPKVYKGAVDKFGQKKLFELMDKVKLADTFKKKNQILLDSSVVKPIKDIKEFW